METSKTNYYDPLLFIVNNHLLLVTDKNYKDLIKIRQISTYFCCIIGYILTFTIGMTIVQHNYNHPELSRSARSPTS